MTIKLINDFIPLVPPINTTAKTNVTTIAIIYPLLSLYAISVAITIEYIPLLDNVEDVKSDYWIDILMRLSVALTKQILGKIRSRYKQSNALWTMDGDQMTEEGNAEIQALREQLNSNSQLCYPID